MGQFSDSVDVLASDAVCPRHGSGSTAEHSNLAHLQLIYVYKTVGIPVINVRKIDNKK